MSMQILTRHFEDRVPTRTYWTWIRCSAARSLPCHYAIVWSYLPITGFYCVPRGSKYIQIRAFGQLLAAWFWCL